jgi:hypothetical protein
MAERRTLSERAPKESEIYPEGALYSPVIVEDLLQVKTVFSLRPIEWGREETNGGTSKTLSGSHSRQSRMF